MRGFGVALVLIFAASSLWALDASTYMPLAVGNRWVMRDSSEGEIDTILSKIVDVTTMDGFVAYISVDSSYTAGDLDTTYFQIRDDGYYVVQTSSPPVKFMPTIFEVGDEWPAMTMDSTWDEEGYTYWLRVELTGRADGFEDVVVPAGEFASCLRLVMSGWYIIEVSMGGMVIYSDSGAVPPITHWLAPEVGVAKYHATDAFTGTETQSELISYSVTKVDEMRTPDQHLLLRVFPNPFNSECVVAAPEGWDVVIYDLGGRAVDRVFGNVWHPDVRLGAGVYIATATDGKRKLATKVIFTK